MSCCCRRSLLSANASDAIRGEPAGRNGWLIGAAVLVVAASVIAVRLGSPTDG
jgi:hypothetical protein